MFYSKEILTRKDSQLGLIWLAATLGPRSGINKLSRKEVNGVDIVKSWFYFLSLPDVNNTWLRLRRDLAAVQSENLDMTSPSTKIDAITFGYDHMIERDLFRPACFSQTFEIEVARNNRNKEVAVEFGWVSQSLTHFSDISSDDQSCSSLFLLPTLDERRRKITLNERPSLTGEESGAEFDIINAGFTEDMLIGDDDGLFIDAEGNIRTDMPEQGFIIKDDGSAHSGIHETSAMERLSGKYRNESEHIEQYFPEDNGNFNSLLMEGHDISVGMEIKDISQSQSQQAGSKPRKAIGLIQDINVTLSNEELRAFRDNYIYDQALIIQDRMIKGKLAAVRAYIDGFFIQPLSINGFGVDLDTFWKSAGVRTLHRDYGNDGYRLLIEQSRNTQLTLARDNHRLPWLSTGEENSFFLDDMLHLEIGRNPANSSSTGTPAGVNTGGYSVDNMSSTERRDQEFGQRDLLPWGQDSHRSVSGQSERSSNFDHPWSDFDFAFGQDAEHHIYRRARSVDSILSTESGIIQAGTGTVVYLDKEDNGRSPQVASQVSTHKQPSTIYEAHYNDIADDFSDVERSGIGGFDIKRAKGVQNQEEFALEKATGDFLRYIRSLLKPLSVNSFSFKDVIGIHHRRDVAAAAFYHVLSE
ncbi:hypothetical protein FBU30_003839 [Linnemannia zychae]|nr:hypothetical protein FBU30_003839 [Linnemannia zychae]